MLKSKAILAIFIIAKHGHKQEQTNVRMMDAFLIESWTIALCGYASASSSRLMPFSLAFFLFSTVKKVRKIEKWRRLRFVEKYISKKQSLKHIPCNKSIWSFHLTFYIFSLHSFIHSFSSWTKKHYFSDACDKKKIFLNASLQSSSSFLCFVLEK